MVQTLYGTHDKTGNPPSHGHAGAYLPLWPQIETSARKPRLRGRRPLADDARGNRRVQGRAWGQNDAADLYRRGADRRPRRSEEHTSELQSLMRISYAVFCLKKKKKKQTNPLTS